MQCMLVEPWENCKPSYCYPKYNVLQICPRNPLNTTTNGFAVPMFLSTQRCSTHEDITQTHIANLLAVCESAGIDGG